jgi:hypothetical protein
MPCFLLDIYDEDVIAEQDRQDEEAAVIRRRMEEEGEATQPEPFGVSDECWNRELF